MNRSPATRPVRYFPALVCSEHDSPVDALLALCVPRDEVMDLVQASWSAPSLACILARVDGGRVVAAVNAPGGRWLACNAFVDNSCTTRAQAERLLPKYQKRGRRACVGAYFASDDEKKPAR